MHKILIRLALLGVFVALSACAPKPVGERPGSSRAEYQPIQDGTYLISAVDEVHLFGTNARAEVDYTADDAPGSIVIDTFARRLYYILEGGRAVRYAIAVGREGLSFRGSGVIGRKEQWPGWQPTRNMIRSRPDLYAEYAGGLPGGLDNPLGARALYLYRGGRDTYFRIHGTIDNAAIGRATSAGCIRLFNQDAIDLFNRVPLGTVVKVRSLEESLALEGPYIDDAYGRAVPETPQNIARREKESAAVAKLEAKKAARAREAALNGSAPAQG